MRVFFLAVATIIGCNSPVTYRTDLGGEAPRSHLDPTAVAMSLVVAALAIYFLPWIIASKREHHQHGAIAVINIFLGWTFVGWVIALAMACSAVKPAVDTAAAAPGGR
jgi:uncharacterized membrane protein